MAKTMNKYEKIANIWWSSLSINEMKKYQSDAGETIHHYSKLPNSDILNIYTFVHPEKKAEVREYYINELNYSAELLDRFPLCYNF